MKNTTTAFIFALFLGMQTSSAQTGQFRVNTNNFIQIGYNSYKALTFGQSTNTPNNGNFSIEYCANCTTTGQGGLNFWKPWPTAGMANFLLYIRDNGNIGIGNNGDNSAKLWVSGNLRVNSTTYFSDARFKQNINELNSSLSYLLKLKTYQYTFIQNKKVSVSDSMSVNVNKGPAVDYNFDDKLHFGLIAQDVEKIFPHLVTKDEKGYLSLNYTELIPVIISAIQEQQLKIQRLEELVSTLKK